MAATCLARLRQPNGYERVGKVSNGHVENYVENPIPVSLISLLALLSAKCTKVQHCR